jgi:hypothetical protein
VDDLELRDQVEVVLVRGVCARRGRAGQNWRPGRARKQQRGRQRGAGGGRAVQIASLGVLERGDGLERLCCRAHVHLGRSCARAAAAAAAGAAASRCAGARGDGGGAAGVAGAGAGTWADVGSMTGGRRARKRGRRRPARAGARSLCPLPCTRGAGPHFRAAGPGGRAAAGEPALGAPPEPPRRAARRRRRRGARARARPALERLDLDDNGLRDELTLEDARLWAPALEELQANWASESEGSEDGESSADESEDGESSADESEDDQSSANEIGY